MVQLPEEKSKGEKGNKIRFSLDYMAQAQEYAAILVGPVLLGGFFGNYLDKKFSSGNILFVSGVLFGFVISIFSLYRKAK